MILADKIINLRKKNGWSQEELAALLGVSRQSVSKYESMQAMPDMDKILKMSKIFGVSTDYLMKDEIEEADSVPVDEGILDRGSVRRVSLEEASDFLSIKTEGAKWVAMGVALCILSPVCLILLCGMASNGMMGENAAGGIGVSVLLLMVAAAVGVFVVYGLRIKKYEYIEKEAIETEYGVSSMANSRKERFHDTYVRSLVLGIVLCVVSVVPLLLSTAIAESEYLETCMVALLLVIVACGVFLIVVAAMPMSAMKQLLEEDDYTREKKFEERRFGPVIGAYWLVVVAAYLAVSFICDNWDFSWIIWPVAAVLLPVFAIIVKAIGGKHGNHADGE